MPQEVSVTLHFGSVAEAAEYLRGHNSQIPISTTVGANVGTADQTQASQPQVQNANPQVSIAQPQVAQAQPTVQTQAATPAGPTHEEVRLALTQYVARGAGRTAATARAILAEFGVTGVKDTKPEHLPAMLHAFQTR